MQDYVEKAKLIKQINDGLADIQKVERLTISEFLERIEL